MRAWLFMGLVCALISGCAQFAAPKPYAGAAMPNCTSHQFVLNRTLNNTVDFGSDEGPVRFNAMDESKVKCVLHRCTLMGKDSHLLHTDRQYVERELQARQHSNVVWGAYHLGHSRSYVEKLLGGIHPQCDPRVQADGFLAEVRATAVAHQTTDKPVLLMLDIEGKPRMNLQEAAAFVEEVYQVTGRYPGIYVNHGEACRDARQITGLTQEERWSLGHCWLCVARYEPFAHEQVAVPAVWGDWTMWQYCGDDEGKFATALSGKSYCGEAPYYSRTGNGFVRKDTGEVTHHVADHDIFNGGTFAWHLFLHHHLTKVTRWGKPTVAPQGELSLASR